ncbi:MAG: hypothetical protein ACXVBQ_16710 [Pseudobdellovibrionaceae bacterium]
MRTIILILAFLATVNANSNGAVTDQKIDKGEAIHRKFLGLNNNSCVTCHAQDALSATQLIHSPLNNFNDCTSCHKTFSQWGTLTNENELSK